MGCKRKIGVADGKSEVGEESVRMDGRRNSLRKIVPFLPIIARLNKNFYGAAPLAAHLSERTTMSETQTQTAPDESQHPIKITDACVAKVKELLAEDGNQGMMLRVFVQGGGCQGFQYGFQFEEKPGEDDTQMHRDGVTFLVDSLSFQYLVGAEIDYKDDLEGSQFVIRNPNAVTTCSCGSSFSA